MRELCDQASLHHRKGAPHHAMGACASARGGAAPARRKSTSHAPAARNGRASVRHDEGAHGWTHFLTKTLPKVAAEMALCVLAYNLTRVMNIAGIKPLMAAIAA
jgi:hypothetical protein